MDSLISVDINHLRQSLSKLQTIEAKKISSLNDEERRIFDDVIRYIGQTRDTKAYPFIYREIISFFPLHTEGEPGTIGGYFTGCRQNGDCSLCLVDEFECNYSAFFLEKPGSFVRLTQGEDNRRIVLFVVPPFTGLTHEEKSILSLLGTREITIASLISPVNNDMTTIKLEDVPERKDDSSFLSAGVAMIILIALLGGGYFVYRHRK